MLFTMTMMERILCQQRRLDHFLIVFICNSTEPMQVLFSANKNLVSMEYGRRVPVEYVENLRLAEY
jgi:hypothetical protein